MVMYELRFLFFFFLQSKLGYYLPYGYIQRKADNDPPPKKDQPNHCVRIRR